MLGSTFNFVLEKMMLLHSFKVRINLLFVIIFYPFCGLLYYFTDVFYSNICLITIFNWFNKDTFIYRHLLTLKCLMLLKVTCQIWRQWETGYFNTVALYLFFPALVLYLFVRKTLFNRTYNMHHRRTRWSCRICSVRYPPM
jgi:hypothetical protein